MIHFVSFDKYLLKKIQLLLVLPLSDDSSLFFKDE